MYAYSSIISTLEAKLLGTGVWVVQVGRSENMIDKLYRRRWRFQRYYQGRKRRRRRREFRRRKGWSGSLRVICDYVVFIWFLFDLRSICIITKVAGGYSEGELLRPLRYSRKALSKCFRAWTRARLFRRFHAFFAPPRKGVGHANPLKFSIKVSYLRTRGDFVGYIKIWEIIWIKIWG